MSVLQVYSVGFFLVVFRICSKTPIEYFEMTFSSAIVEEYVMGKFKVINILGQKNGANGFPDHEGSSLSVIL